jgi:hypothetical protein
MTYALRQAEGGTPVVNVCRQLGVSEAIELGQFSSDEWYAKGQAIDQSALRIRFHEIANAGSRFGYQPIDVMLRRER